MYLKSLLCWLILATTLFAADPKAVIVAKPSAALHESVWLQTTGSVGKTFIWKILPPQADKSFTILPIFGGMNTDGTPIVNYWAHFSSSTPGTIYFVFVATEDNRADVAIHTLVYGGDIPIPNPDIPTPLPDIPQPSAELTTLVQPIIDSLINTNKIQLKKDALSLTQFYLDMADTLTRDSTAKIIKTTEQVRQINIAAGQLMFQNTGIKGRYAGLNTSVDKVLATKIGLEIVDITDAKRTEIISTFRAIAWAALQVGKK